MTPELVDRARRTGWQTAADSLFGHGTAWRWTVEDRRYAAPLLAVGDHDEPALVTSPGNGSLPILLASVCRQVWITGPSPETEFTLLRAADAGFDNISVVGNEPDDPPRFLVLPAPDRAPVQFVPGADRICALVPLRTQAPPAGRVFDRERRDIPWPDPEDCFCLVAEHDTAAWSRAAASRWPVVNRLPGLRRAAGWMGSRTRHCWVTAHRQGQEARLDRLARAILEAEVRRSLAFTNRGTVTVPYDDAAGNPALVARLDAGRSLVRNEARAVSALSRTADPVLSEALPQLLSVERYGRRTAAFYRAAKGASPEPPRGEARIRRELTWLTSFLRALYHARPLSPPGDGAGPDRFTDQTPGLGPAAAAVYADRAGRLQAAGLAPSWIHGDLHTGNFLDDAGRRTVIDWEYARTGYAAFDWCHYIAVVLTESGRLKRLRRRPVETLHRMAGGEPGWVKTHTRAFLDALGLPPDLWRPFLETGLIEFVYRRYGGDVAESFASTVASTDTGS